MSSLLEHKGRATVVRILRLQMSYSSRWWQAYSSTCLAAMLEVASAATAEITDVTAIGFATAHSSTLPSTCNFALVDLQRLSLNTDFFTVDDTSDVISEVVANAINLTHLSLTCKSCNRHVSFLEQLHSGHEVRPRLTNLCLNGFRAKQSELIWFLPHQPNLLNLAVSDLSLE